jgi:hypothetical protein
VALGATTGGRWARHGNPLAGVLELHTKALGEGELGVEVASVVREKRFENAARRIQETNADTGRAFTRMA